MVDKINPLSSETEHHTRCVWLLNVWSTFSQMAIEINCQSFAFQYRYSYEHFNPFASIRHVAPQTKKWNQAARASLVCPRVSL
jgi:hypothetical protein